MKNSIIIAILVVLLVFIACKPKTNIEQKLSNKITIASYSGDAGSLVYIAQDQDLFLKNGLDVTIVNYEAGKLATDALIKGEADVSTGADFVFVSNSFDYSDLRIFGSIASVQDCKLILRIDQNTQGPEELSGKRIGITKKSSGEFYIGRLLTFYGLSLDDVEIVDLNPNEIVEAMNNATIDAALTWEPNIYKIKIELGENVAIWPGQNEQDLYFLLISHKNWLENNPVEVEGLLNAFIQAEEYVKNNEQDAILFLKGRFNYSDDYSRYYWQGIKLTVNLPQALILAMEDQGRWRIENKLTTNTHIPNYLEYIYMDGLKNIKPEVVTILD